MLEELKVRIGASINEFQSAMANVQRKLADVTDSMVKFTTNIESQMKKAGQSFEKFADDAQQAGEGLQAFGETISTYITLPMIAAGGASIKLASDMQESLNKVNVAFGSSAEGVIKWSETSIEKMGMASGSALDAAALFGDMATSMGISQQRAADMAMSLTQLGADLSSFKNIPIEQAMQALNGVFTGETESLKMLGVVMTETQLKAFALTQGITKNVDKMTEAEVVALRYAFVLDRTKNAQGDFARTQDGAANQMRMFTENLKQLGTTFGEILLPAFTEAITKLNEMTKSFSDLPTETKKSIIEIGSVTASIGLLALTLGTVLAKLKDFKDALKDVIIFANTFRKTTIAILASLGLLVEYMEHGSEATSEFSSKFDEALARAERAKQKDDLSSKILAEKTKLYFTDMAQFILEGFGVYSDSLSKMNKELANSIQTNTILRDNIKVKMSFEETRQALAQNSTMLAEYTKKVNENAGKTDYLSKSYMALGEAAKSWKPVLNDNSNMLEQTKNKADELAKKNEELRQSAIKSADGLGSAIVTALKNKQKAEEDSIQSLRDVIEENKKLYDEQVSDVRKSHDDIVQSYKDSYAKIEREINERFDNLTKSNLDSFQSQIDANGERIKDIMDATKDENVKLLEEKYDANVDSLMADEELGKDRAKLVDEISKLAIEKEKQALRDGRINRIESVKNLTDEENALIRSRVLEQRQIEINSLNQTNAILFDTQQRENARLEQERANELQKYKDKLQERLTETENYFKLTESINETLYTNEFNRNKAILDEKVNNLKTLNTEVQLQNEALKLTLPKNQAELIALLKTYNPEWNQAGKSFGEELISGLNSKKQSIEQAVNSILSQVNSAKALTVPTPAKVDEKKQTTTSNTITNPKLETVTPPSVKVPTTDFLLPDWLKYGSSIPKMASGGIVSSPTLAIIGEGSQPEAVIPLNRLNDMMNQTVQIFLDGREITQAVAPRMVDHLRTKLGVNY